MKYLKFLLLVLPVICFSCGSEDEPLPTQDKLIGYWAITHIKTIEHLGGVHDTSDKDVPPHGIDSYIAEGNPRWDVLIFDEDFVTVRGDMPSRPKAKNYDETPEGQIEYMTDLEKWYNSIGELSDLYTCPVGTYTLKGNELVIGSLNMGTLHFTSNDEFTLDYKKTLGNNDYKRLTYTYSRIYSLNWDGVDSEFHN